MLDVDYVVSGSVRRQGDRLTVMVELAETRTARIVWAETFRPPAGRHVPRPRRDRQPDRRVGRQRDRDQRAQPRRPAAAELARRVGRASSRPLAHVPLQPVRQRAGPAFLRARGAARSDLRARPRRPLLHHWQNAFQGWGQRETGDRPGVRGRRTERDGRRSRPRRALGDGTRALAARPSRPVAGRAGAGRRAQPELRPRPLHAWPSSIRPAGDPACRDRIGRPVAPAQPVRPAAVRHARLARHGARCASAGSRRPPTGASRPRPVRTRMRTSWRSPPAPWRWPAGWTRRATIWPRSARQLPHYRIDDLITAMQFPPDGEKLFREAVQRIGMQ